MHSLRNPSVLLLVVTALLITGAAARAQQDGDVTVIIKAKSKPTALPTLLVMCDLVCDWKLDGEVKGHIDAGGSAKVKVEPGEHMVEAATEDGVDQVKQPSTVKPTGQTMVSIELWPIRYARLVAEQEERDKAAQEGQAKTEREMREKAEQEAREKAARERAVEEEAERQPWTDPATGLTWTKQGSGDVSWPQAVYYCRNLRLAGYDDWRLPTIDELSGTNGNEANVHGDYLKGDPFPITVGWIWSNSKLGKKGRAAGYAWVFQSSRYGPDIHSVILDCEACGVRALCVRRTPHP
jgi:hypothetical protein